jgi:hypothetical protein
MPHLSRLSVFGLVLLAVFVVQEVEAGSADDVDVRYRPLRLLVYSERFN